MVGALGCDSRQFVRRDLVLTPLELIDKIAALVPRPRTHRHRYYGVLAPNAPLRAAVTALAPAAVTAVPPAPTFRVSRRAPLLHDVRLHDAVQFVDAFNEKSLERCISNLLREATFADRSWTECAGRRCGRLPPGRNRRAMCRSGTRQPSSHRRSSSISAAPGSRQVRNPKSRQAVARHGVTRTWHQPYSPKAHWISYPSVAAQEAM